LPPYTWDDKIAAISAAHSKAINDTGQACTDKHQCPGEPPIGDRLKNAGISWTACAENVGGTSPVPDRWGAVKTNIEQGMLNEQPPKNGHRLNLLSTTYHRMGIGVYIANDGFTWITEDFSN
jgi:uncharacterized protein YkwD